MASASSRAWDVASGFSRTRDVVSGFSRTWDVVSGFSRTIAVTMPGTYRPEVIEELARHGLCPKPGTPAELLREQINDLYRFEIRRLRDRCRAGEFSIGELPGHVVELRHRYMLLSIPIAQWVVLP